MSTNVIKFLKKLVFSIIPTRQRSKKAENTEKRMQTECKEFNHAIVKEKNVIITSSVLTRGLCLSEELTIASVLKCPRIDGSWFVGMRTRHHKFTCRCEVTAILVLYVFQGDIFMDTF
ncbi:putative protein DA1 [Helianthus anomalus]